MSIVFLCPKCTASLRVPDSAAGKRAKCPRCGEIVPVPEAGVTPPPLPKPLPEATSARSVSTAEQDAQPGPGAESINPYAPPKTPTPFLAPVSTAEIQPQIISFSQVFDTTWRLFTDHFGEFVAMGALVIGVSIVANLLIAVIARSADADPLAAQTVSVLIGFASGFIILWLEGGVLLYSMDLAKGLRPSFSRIFLPLNRFVGFFAVSFLYWLLVTLGIVLLIIPGIILAMVFFCAPAVYLDGRAGVMESFRISRTITRGNRFTIFWLVLVTWVLMLIAVVVTCGSGSSVAMPFGRLLTAVIYTSCAGLLFSAHPPVVTSVPIAEPAPTPGPFG